MTETPTKLTDVIGAIRPLDPAWIEKARQRTSRLVMPPRALGRLHDVSEQICAIQQTLQPAVDRKAVVVMAGDHGVAAEGVSAFPQAVTGEMIRTFINGGAGINVLARMIGARIQVVDMGVVPDLDPTAMGAVDRLVVNKIRPGTANFTLGPAMSVQEAAEAVMSGFRIASGLFADGVQLLGTGDMGIGNTTPSAAIGAVVTGCRLEEMVGRGTGVDDEGLNRKKTVIRRAIEVNRPDPEDGLDTLAKVGGFEIGGIAGCILAGAYHRCPVVVDGFISTAGALIAHRLCPAVTDYLIAGHRSEEPGHRRMLAHLRLDPLLSLGMRLGEGTGGAAAMTIVAAAVQIFNEMATFEEAGVSEGPG